MAEEVPHGEFLLPPEFLTDDDILMDFKPKTQNTEIDSVVNFPFDYSSGFNSFNTHSGLSSPGESIGSSESEEEDYLAGLTRKMANSSLLDDLWKEESHKSRGISVSPQSTLCGFKPGSTRGYPNSPSPPSLAASDRNDAGWDLLYAAAGEVARLRMMEEANSYFQNRGLNPIETIPNPNPNLVFRPNHSLSYQHLQIAKFQQLRREQLMRQQRALHVAQAKARASDRQPANLSTVTWPTLQQSFQNHSQQQPATAGSGMRAVFLGNTNPRRESAGTGVFIPRRAGSCATEPRKNSGCSTVLLPDKVVQALNLNLEAIDAHSRLNNALTSDLDVLKMRNNVPMVQHHQKSNVRPSSLVAHTDLRLPQEWTY